MSTNEHCVAGFFSHRAPALDTKARFHVLGFSADQLQLFNHDGGAHVPHAERRPEAGSNAALKDMLVDGAIGSAVGMGLGALTEVALVAANVSLFVASPLLAPLVLLGWGAMVGIGCTIGNTLSGIMAGAVSGWVFTAAMLVAVAAGLALQRRFPALR